MVSPWSRPPRHVNRPSSNHNSRETPLFAKSIEKKALARQAAARASSSDVRSPRVIARAFTPKLAALVERPLFSEVWSDRDLGERERSIATIAILIANGNLDELRPHLQRAHDGGMTCAELSALITHTAFYAGFPAAITASGIAASLFEGCQRHPAPHGIGKHPPPPTLTLHAPRRAAPARSVLEAGCRRCALSRCPILFELVFPAAGGTGRRCASDSAPTTAPALSPGRWKPGRSPFASGVHAV